MVEQRETNLTNHHGGEVETAGEMHRRLSNAERAATYASTIGSGATLGGVLAAGLVGASAASAILVGPLAGAVVGLLVGGMIDRHDASRKAAGE